MQSKIVRGLTGLVSIALTAHLVATSLQNTPDSYNLDLRRYVGGWTIPGWRFFAPNPGVHNVHLLVRTSSSKDAEEPGDWIDVTPATEHGILNVLLNPRSRGPKALFDAMQQLSVMQVNHSAMDWIVTSLPYRLVADATRGLIRDKEANLFQFLLMNYYPAAPPDQRMLPVLVSEWIPIRPALELSRS
ncbi:DUF5819 family protein [Microbacterium sp. VKM Ac-2923]|uniref:DUF5819 family protein n=1 Tax=Microbacterium sp. VKM Ac-2923 TaxID=2929476 RepID=UPI001FB43EF2|nr:DUF5819 family protein [Microbacterium sp. VKM Ac-2923]MCJ1707113.1 DUF5819 family protein [Microbacterium sp. VKM Ac-2923]